MLPILPIAFLVTVAADQLDQLGNEGIALLSKARLGGTVRQCSCAEQYECAEEMKKQGDACTYPCFSKFEAITSNTAALRQCFDSKIGILENFIDCFQTRVEGCVESMNGPMIQKTDINEVFRLGERRLVQTPSPTIQAFIAPIKRYVDAAAEFAHCVKDCFLQQNAMGYCFDRKGCQPLINDAKAKQSLKTCTRRIQWKKQAGEVCDCSVNAGLTDLRQYCGMFKLMAAKRTRTN